MIATSNHAQMAAHDRGRGNPHDGRALPPARERLTRVQAGRVSPAFRCPPLLTGRSFAFGRRIGRFFADGSTLRRFTNFIRAGLSEGVATVLASEPMHVNPAQDPFGHAPEPLPRHSPKSFPQPLVVGPTQPREAVNAVPIFHASGSSHDR